MAVAALAVTVLVQLIGG